MVRELSDDAKPSIRIAQAPWNEDSEPWRQLEAQLPSDHLGGTGVIGVCPERKPGSRKLQKPLQSSYAATARLSTAL